MGIDAKKKRETEIAKKRSNNPFGIKGFNANNPLGIKGFSSKDFKIPKIKDPFAEAMKSAQSFNKQYGLSNTRIPTTRIDIPRRRTIRPSIPSIRTTISARPIMIQNQPVQPIRPLIDIPKIVERLSERRGIIQRAPQQNTMSLIERIRRLNELAQQTSQEQKFNQIHEELAQKTKEISDLNNKVEKVSDKVNEIKEKIPRLEEYHKEITDYITNLLKMQKEQGMTPNAEISTLLTYLISEKQNTDKEIQTLKTELAKVVEQQEKDAPFTQSMRRIYDDKRFNERV